MIYRVVLDDTYDLHTSDIDCMLLNPSLELEMNSAGSFNFTLPPAHPYWDNIEILKSTIDVYEDDDLIFTGRVANIDKNWNNERVVECEGALAYFNDSIHRQNKWENPLPIAVDPDDQPEDPAQHRQNFLEDILNNHNAFVGNATNRQIRMGHIYVDPFLVTREVDYDKTLDILNRMCIDTNGGYFMIRKDPETHLLYLDWLKDFTEESGQPASFGVNLLDFNTGLHAEDICTGVLARGATVNDQVVTLSNVELVDETTYPDMSVDHYTDRYQDILWHREGVSKFGQVVQVHDFPDAQTDWKNSGQVVANSLFEEARKWLEEKNTKIESIEVEVAELSWLQEGVPKYKLGQIVEILDDAHMAGEPYEVRRLPMYKLSCDLSSGSKKVTLGRPPKKELTQISASNSDSSTLSSGNSSGSSSGGGSGSGEECKVHDVRVDGTSVVSNKIANISLTGKADVSTVNALAATVANKADTSTVTALANVVSGKQDQIEFNTLEAATETLTRLKADNVVYNLGGGTEVEANPSGSATDDLEKIRIGQTIYSLPEGGGGTDMVIPDAEYATSERNSTSQVTYEATDDFNAIAINLSINGEASSYAQTCGIATTGTILSETTNSRDAWSNPNRNYAIRVDSLNLSSGDDVIFSNTGTANYIVRLRGIVKLNTEVKVKSEISNVITADNNNNSRTVALSPDKAYMVLAFGFSGNGSNAGDVSVTSSGLSTSCTLSAQSVKMICTFIVDSSSVDIVFGNDSNYYSKGHIIYEVDVKKVEYATKEDLENYVVANPEDTPTDDISSIKIGDTIYNIAGRSNTNYGKFTCDVLFDTPTASAGWGDPITICTKSVVEEYDVLVLTFGVTHQETATILVADLLINQNGRYYYLPTTNANGLNFHISGLRIDSNNNLLFHVDVSGDYLYKVYGLKFENKLINRSDIYSEEERIIGRWTDGKPLYQKTYRNISITNSADNIIDSSFGTDKNICTHDIEFRGISGNYRNDYNNSVNDTLYVNNNGQLIYYFYKTGNWSQLFDTLDVTLQYTKTTDAPGSGVIPEDPQMVMMSDYYSEDEQVVGRWTDGKPLYQKTWVKQLPAAHDNDSQSYLIDSNVSYISELVMASGYIKDTNANAVSALNGGIPNLNGWGYGVHLTQNKLVLYSGSTTTYIGNGIAVVTLQYTKTTDAPGTGPTKGNLIYLPALYSEEEREIGVWTDGKPLYQKTINVGSLSAGQDIQVNAPSNVDKMVRMFGNAHSSNYNQWVNINFPHQNITSYIVTEAYLASTNKINIHTGTDFALDEIYITIQYTKTTDQPGSGKYLPDGQLAHHYSTSEKIVGTWIDGSTVYERTITGFSIALQSGSVRDTGVDISYVSKLISVDALGNDDISVLPVAGYKINNTLQMIGYQTGNVINCAIIQYTKSS